MIDERRFGLLCLRFAPRLDAHAAFTELSTAYENPTRAYHNAFHIADCLEQFDSVSQDIHLPYEAEFALWYHDLVYDPRAKDNESRSAAHAAEALHQGGTRAESIQRVVELILATQHTSAPLSPDAQFVVDIDLSILGREPALFDNYNDAIRREYDFVPEETYRKARADVLRNFLARPRIFLTKSFFDRYETSTRTNLDRAIVRLSSS